MGLLLASRMRMCEGGRRSCRSHALEPLAGCRTSLSALEWHAATRDHGISTESRCRYGSDGGVCDLGSGPDVRPRLLPVLYNLMGCGNQ